MKILFTCDLHGKKNLYEEMFRFALANACASIIIGGDLFPTRLANPLKLISGGADFNQSLQVQTEFIDSYLVPVMGSFMHDHGDIRILYVPGNHDWKVSVNRLMQHLPGALCMHGRTETLDGITFFGYGCVTDSTFWVKDYVRRDMRGSRHVPSRYPLVSTDSGICVSDNSEYAYANPSIEEELSPFELNDPHNTVCIFHCPPYGTGLDTLHDGRPIGSRSIAHYILRNKPLLSLHGHIHESPYMSGKYHVRLGDTISINPGHHFRELHAVCFDTSDPANTLVHRIFGTGTVNDAGMNTITDRYARIVKAFFMKSVLKKQ